MENASNLETSAFLKLLKEKQKIGRNPKKAAEPIVIPARNAVKFTPGKKYALPYRNADKTASQA